MRKAQRWFGGTAALLSAGALLSACGGGTVSPAITYPSPSSSSLAASQSATGSSRRPDLEAQLLARHDLPRGWLVERRAHGIGMGSSFGGMVTPACLIVKPVQRPEGSFAFAVYEAAAHSLPQLSELIAYVPHAAKWTMSRIVRTWDACGPVTLNVGSTRLSGVLRTIAYRGVGLQSHF